MIATREGEGSRKEVHVNSWASPNLVLCQVMLVLFEFLLVPFEVLDHQILAGELVVVGEVIDDLVVC